MSRTFFVVVYVKPPHARPIRPSTIRMAPMVLVMVNVPLPLLSGSNSRTCARRALPHPAGAHQSSPLGRIGAVANALFDLETPRKQPEHFDHAETSVERVARERAWRRPAGVARLQALAGHLLDLDRLTQDQRERRPENHGRAHEIAED